MKKLLKYLYLNTIAGKFIIGIGIKLHHQYRIYFVGEEKFIRERFKKRVGVLPNLENPLSFNEKINWLKLNDRTPLHTTCADKYAVREYVKEKVGEKYLIPLVFQSYNIKDLLPDNLPDFPFIIKTNHDSSGGVIVKNKEAINWKKLQKKFKKLLRINYYYQSKEWQYKNIKPCIIAEKLLISEKGVIPFDYKLHCIHGKVIVIQVDIDRYTNHRRNLYSTDWKLQPFTWSAWRNNEPLWVNGREIDPPSNLKEMIQIAEKLSQGFAYARIDLYEHDNKVYFGEITFHHGSGYEILYPKIWDKKFGDMLTLRI